MRHDKQTKYQSLYVFFTLFSMSDGLRSPTGPAMVPAPYGLPPCTSSLLRSNGHEYLPCEGKRGKHNTRFELPIVETVRCAMANNACRLTAQQTCLLASRPRYIVSAWKRLDENNGQERRQNGGWNEHILLSVTHVLSFRRGVQGQYRSVRCKRNAPTSP